MTLSYFRKHQRAASLMFAFVFLSQSAYPSYLSVKAKAAAMGGGQPVSASTSGMVDPYTGDFHYSVPLLTVPGPNGENVSIAANYHAGIRVDEKASWLGLGWDYNPGEISRQVVGAPDDWNGKVIYNYSYNSATQPNEATIYYGAMYTKNIVNAPLYPTLPYTSPCVGFAITTYNKSTDYIAVNRLVPLSEQMRINAEINPIGGQRFKRYTLPYENLAYDNYMVSGPMSGMMKPYFIGLQRIHRSMPLNNTSPVVSANTQKQMQFYMESSSNSTVMNQGDATAMNTSTNRIKSGTFIKYYTNADINSGTNLFDNSTQKGFLDYHTVSGTRRPSTDYDQDGIGAYEVTDAGGMTYHYSLPVYAFNETDKVLEATGASGYYTSATLTSKPKSYASSWKLTAITGPDYQDSNNNHMVDAGDTGYWVGYNYSLWSSDYTWSTSQYNYKDDMYSPAMYCLPGNYGGPHNLNYLPNTYKPKKSITTGETQVYYLNYIQTSSHTALFVKSIRQDEQSYDKVLGRASLPTPMLKLDRIILLRNEDLGVLLTASDPLSGADLDSRFNYGTCAAAQSDVNFINATKYRDNKLMTDRNTLKSVEFISDYSLCRKYHYNIDNTFTTTSILATINPCDYTFFNGTNFIYAKYDKTVSGNATIPHYSNSGKLSLNSIKFYDISAEKISPSLDFDYAKTDSNKNPDYDPDKTDLWGYYKSDYVSGGSHYPSNAASLHIDAWSLREITSPLGGKTQMTYESDRYEREGFLDDSPLIYNTNNVGFDPVMPSFIFPVQSTGTGLSGPVIYEYADVSDFISAYGSEGPTTINPQYNMTETVFPLRESCPYDYTLGYTTVNYFIAESHYGLNSGSTNYLPDIDMAIVCPGGVPSEYDKDFGYGYTVFKMNYVNGGGLRVANIKTLEPTRGETYTENFEYKGGYCVAVPKRLAIGAYNGPSNFGLLINDKMSIEGLPSAVGYSSVNITHTSMNGINNGTTSYEFENNTINNPIGFVPFPDHNNYQIKEAPSSPDNVNTMINPNARCPGFTGNPTGPGCTPTVPLLQDYSYAATLLYDNEALKLLGKVKTVTNFPANSSTPVSSMAYNYDKGASSYIQETTVEGNTYTTFIDEIPVAYPQPGPPSGCSAGAYTVYCHLYDVYNVSSLYRNHDCLLTSTTNMRDGISITEEVMARDRYTGFPLKTRTTDPTQGIFVSKSLPAYVNSSYTALGLKTVNESYKNQPGMMEQSQTLRFPYSAATANGVDEVSDPYASIVVSESKNTYSTSYPYRLYNASTSQYENATQTKNWWRLYETYTRLLDDLTDYTSTTYNWRKLSEGTLYDLQNNKIEEKGLNDRKAASKWGYQNRYKLSDISNANYNSFTFTGFEDKFLAATNTYHFGGEVTGGQYQYTSATQVQPAVNPRNPPTVFIVNPHTGYYLARVPAATDGPAFNAKNFEAGRTYIAKVWVHRSSPATAKLVIDLNGYLDLGGGSTSAVSTHKEISKPDAANVTVGDWTLMSLEVIVPGNFDLASTHSMKVYVKNASTTSEAYFDDFAFHPKDAVMGGNVYEEKTGLLKAQLDNDNFATLYNYDNAGRVISTYKEYSGGIKKVSENQYHFAKP